MHLKLKFLIVSTVFTVTYGCGSARRLKIKPVSKINKTQPVQKTKTTFKKNINLNNKSGLDRANDYILKFFYVAQEEMRKFKIPASITLAQGILESGVGYGRLAMEANNHFGIKCHKDWKGKKIFHDDDQKGECFRVYINPNNSYRDHSNFLSNRSRYDFLFDFKITNYKAWAKGLKKAGYATDPNYPKKLIDIIERYQLYKFDNLKLSKNINKNNKAIKYHKVEKGDTLYSISKKYAITVNDIIIKNKLINNKIFLGQILEIPFSNN